MASSCLRLWRPARRTAKAARSVSCTGPLQLRLCATGTAAVREAGQEASSTESPLVLERESTWGERLLAPTPPTEATLGEAPVDEIVVALTAMRDRQGWSFHGQDIDRHGRIVQLVRHLVGARDQPLSLFIYECMLDAMADPQGSVEGLRRLLDDMSSQKIQPTAKTCQSVLAALANHPDYTLRLNVLAVMHEYWFTINRPARQSVVLGLLREEQYELAYARLTEMIEQDVDVDLWVYDIFIMTFGKLGFLDEMLLLLIRRKHVEASDGVITSLLYYVLDVCSQGFHHSGTVLAWNAVVRNSLLPPPDGIMDNVLATAARHGDAALATEALDLMSRRTRVMTSHYEAVAEAFARGGDMAGAFRILCIMKQNSMRIDRGSTRTMHEALKRSPGLLDEAEAVLRDLGADGQLPRAVASVVMEASSDIYGSERAMDLYRDVPRLCGKPCDARTIQTLIINSRDDETRRSLAKDYAAGFAQHEDPVRDPRVHSALISACAESGEMDLAFRFAAQAMAAARGPRRGLAWLRPLVECAAACEDGRIWDVVDELERKGDDETRQMVQLMLHQTRLTKLAEAPRTASG